MSGKDILARVRRAVHLADSLHVQDTVLAERLLSAAERCRESVREFHKVLEQLRPHTVAGEAARVELLQQLSELDCGDKLLRSMLDTGSSQSEIHTHPAAGQVQ